MTTTTVPTREEIDELIEFCRLELADRLVDGVEEQLFNAYPAYVHAAKRALSIAERLPALVERETLKTAEPSVDAINASADYLTEISGRFSSSLPATFRWNDCLMCAYSIDVAPLIADRDRLVAEVERLTKERREEELLEDERLGKALARAQSAEGSLSAARATIAELREALAPFASAWADALSAFKGQLTQTYGVLGAIAAYHVNGVHFKNAHAALAKLDAQPAETIDLACVTSFDDACRQAERLGTGVFDASRHLTEEEHCAMEAALRKSARMSTSATVARLAETERALAEAVEIMKPLYYFGIGATEIDIDTFTAARAFVEKHGGIK